MEVGKVSQTEKERLRERNALLEREGEAVTDRWAVDTRDPNDTPDLAMIIAGWLREHGYSALVSDCALGRRRF